VVTYVLVFLGGYLVGSIPIGYLIVRTKNNLDIREAGSGNVGGFNAFFVTGSKATGIVVGILDGVKGLAAVLALAVFGGREFWLQAVCLYGAIFGHNYPVWLKFKGGRGLSTTAGGMFILGFSYTIVWCTLWVVARIAKRDILTSNIVAILFTPTLLGVLPWGVVRGVNLADPDLSQFLIFSSLTSSILLLSHHDVVRDLWRNVPAGQG